MHSFDKSKERISGLTFEPVMNVRHAVSHAERTELCEASYLLKPEDRLANCVVFGGGRENEITELFYAREAAMSRQAKRACASPFWEGVAVLPAVEEFESVDAYHAAMIERLMSFKGEFEKATGCSVLLMTIHLDEGEKDPETGIVSRNPHAHILIDRTISAALDRKPRKEAKTKRATDPNRRVLWKPDSTALARVQTLCADALEMKRGSTVQERGGKPARKHIPHKQWRELKAREAALEKSLESAIDELAHVHAENTALSLQNRAHEAKAAQARVEAGKAAYAAVRAFLKGTGKAKQTDYQSLKKLHDAGHAVIQSWADYIDKTDDAQIDAEALLWAIRGHELSVLSELRGHVGSGVSGGNAGRFDSSVETHIAPLKQWSRENEDLYLLPEKNEAGRRLAFVDQGDKIDVKMLSDYDVVLQAIKLSAAKWPSGFELFGPPEFLRLAEQCCAELGIENYSIRGQSRSHDGPGHP